jgi:hypothetical protein
LPSALHHHPLQERPGRVTRAAHTSLSKAPFPRVQGAWSIRLPGDRTVPVKTVTHVPSPFPPPKAPGPMLCRLGAVGVSAWLGLAWCWKPSTLPPARPWNCHFCSASGAGGREGSQLTSPSWDKTGWNEKEKFPFPTPTSWAVLGASGEPKRASSKVEAMLPSKKTEAERYENLGIGRVGDGDPGC